MFEKTDEKQLEFDFSFKKPMRHGDGIDFSYLEKLPIELKVNEINRIKLELQKHSPFKNEPVDCVVWVKNDSVSANDYNPNSVAPPEMELLRTSINNDGYTQPIVTYKEGDEHEVVDGFHRSRVGKEYQDIKDRVHGYLPVVVIRKSQEGRSDRIASTIRHNRARGKHKVDSMSDIVLELKNRNWTNKRISKELGMDEDEILRLCQITGLSGLFSDQEFSKSWDIEGEILESDFEELSDEAGTLGEDIEKTRTVNTSDENRIFHKYDKWECYKAGFYNKSFPGMKKSECEEKYRDFLSDTKLFAETLEKIIVEWKYSCEHYLTNVAMNRIAWLGQAALCYATGIPSEFRSGYFLLTKEQQEKADETALIYLNKWLKANNMEEVTMEQALSHGRQSDIY